MNPNIYNWGHGPRLTAFGQSQLANQLNQTKGGEKVPKEQWKKCSYCEITTDPDEKDCPGRGLEDNPGHELEMVELTFEEVKKLWKEGKIRTKHVANLEKRLSQ